MTEGGPCYENGSQEHHFRPLGCRRPSLDERFLSWSLILSWHNTHNCAKYCTLFVAITFSILLLPAYMSLLIEIATHKMSQRITVTETKQRDLCKSSSLVSLRKPSLGQRWGGIPSKDDVPIRPGAGIENSRWCLVQDFPQFLIGDVLPNHVHILVGPVGHGIRQKPHRIG